MSINLNLDNNLSNLQSRMAAVEGFTIENDGLTAVKFFSLVNEDGMIKNLRFKLFFPPGLSECSKRERLRKFQGNFMKKT